MKILTAGSAIPMSLAAKVLCIISYWAGNAPEKLCQSKYDCLREKCLISTGCFMTADGLTMSI